MENRNRQVLLKHRPSGAPTIEDFEITDAPLPEPEDGQVLVRGARSATLHGVLGTPGLGKGTFATLVYATQPGLVPETNHPLAEITFAATTPGRPPVRVKTVLDGRC